VEEYFTDCRGGDETETAAEAAADKAEHDGDRRRIGSFHHGNVDDDYVSATASATESDEKRGSSSRRRSLVACRRATARRRDVMRRMGASLGGRLTENRRLQR